MVSMDAEGTTIIRDLRSHDIVSTIRLDTQQYQSGAVLFNNRMKSELFIALNKDLYVYHVDGQLIQHKEFDDNIT